MKIEYGFAHAQKRILLSTKGYGQADPWRRALGPVLYRKLLEQPAFDEPITGTLDPGKGGADSEAPSFLADSPLRRLCSPNLLPAATLASGKSERIKYFYFLAGTASVM